MPVLNYAIGTLNPIVYFENRKGEISMPPSTEDALRIRDDMSRRGWDFKETGNTLAEIDEFQKRLQNQELVKRKAELERDEITFGQVRKSVRDRLYARMVSGSTSPYEREFIQQYLMLRDEKREQWRKRFLGDVCYINLRENQSVHHLQDIVDNVPEMKQDACKRCGRYRRAKNSEYCIGCMGAVREEAHG